MLRPEDRERLRGRAAEAVRRARRHGEALAAITVRMPRRRRPDGDRRRLAPRAARRGSASSRPTATASRSPALGCVAAIDERGPDRFAAAARRWRALAERAACDDPDGPRGSGPVAVGGFAFAADGGGAPHWAGYAPASLHVPEVALARRGDDVRLTLAALARPDDAPDDARRAPRGAAPASCARRPLPLLDPDPAGPLPRRQRDAARALRGGGRPRRSSASAPARSTRSCSRARSRSTRPRRTTRRACSASCARRSRPATSSAPRAATARSSPRARSCSSAARGCAPGTLALAGLDAPQRRPGRRRPPRRAAPALRQGPRGAGDRQPPDRPRAAAAQRLGDRGRGAGRREDGEHPAPGDADPRAARPPGRARSSSPGCCTRRRPSAASRIAAAAPLIPALEGLDRGWYAGPVGWTDRAEDGEFCVALRCALLTRRGRALLRGRRRRARLRPGGRAGRDRGQAAGAAAGPRRLTARATACSPSTMTAACRATRA